MKKIRIIGRKDILKVLRIIEKRNEWENENGIMRGEIDEIRERMIESKGIMLVDIDIEIIGKVRDNIIEGLKIVEFVNGNESNGEKGIGIDIGRIEKNWELGEFVENMELDILRKRRRWKKWKKKWGGEIDWGIKNFNIDINR